jgi:hypothetical protein
LILTMIRPLAGATGAAAAWACIRPDCPINRNNKIPAARLDHLNFLEAAIVMDGSDKGRLRANNGMMHSFYTERRQYWMDYCLIKRS